MRKVLFAGDIHANFQVITNLRKRYPHVDEIVIVGDFGYGFPSVRGEKYHNYRFLEEISKVESPKVRFIRGNHDNFKAIQRDFPIGSVSFIPDGTIEDDVLYIGGAWSIDGVTGVWPNNREIDVDWWFDEELTGEEWYNLVESLRGREDEISMVVSHDLPGSVFDQILPGQKNYSTRTQRWLDLVREKLPNVKIWIGGHYHVSRRFKDGNTTFIVLNCDGKDVVELSI